MSSRAWLLNGVLTLALWAWLIATARELAQFVPAHLFG